MALHIIPLKDESPHQMDEDCDCHPETLWKDDDGSLLAQPIIVHNASDHREAAEVITQESMTPEKQWGVFQS